MNNYEVADSSVVDMVEKVITAYPGKFSHIRSTDIHVVFKSAEKSSWRARICLVKGALKTLTNKSIFLEVWKEDWESNVEQRPLTIYHELLHIDYDPDKNKLKMRRHDVEDFEETIAKFGIHGEKAADVLPK